MYSSGIYMLVSDRVPGKFYIGSAMNLQKRKTRHIYELRNGNHFNSKLQNHVNKYGISDIQFVVILYCKPSELLFREQELIDKLKPFFNINPTASNRSGAILSEYSRKKISEYSKKVHRLSFASSLFKKS